MSEPAQATVPCLNSLRPIVDPTAACLTTMPYSATLPRHAMIALSDQVDPAPEVGVDAAAAGDAARLLAAASRATAATAISRRAVRCIRRRPLTSHPPVSAGLVPLPSAAAMLRSSYLRR